jgi:ABC-type transport system involved in cytochrome bd biosynthesis fused ATPase/permease subunit
MNRKTLNVIIPIVSVAVMVIWGTLAKSYEHSWLAVFVGGILMAISTLSARTKTNKGE